MITTDLVKAGQKDESTKINVLVFEHSHLFIDYDEMDLMVSDINVLFEDNVEEQFNLPKFKEQLQQDLHRLKQASEGIHEEWMLFQNLSVAYKQIKEEFELAYSQLAVSACI